MKKWILLFAVMLAGCNQGLEIKQKEYDYSDVAAFIEWSKVFNQDENDYSVYFFSVTCGHCKEIKEEILTYYFGEYEKMYFVETSYDAVFGPPKDLTGISTIEDFYIFGTPFLINISKRTISNYYAGKAKIREYIMAKTSS